MELSLELSTKRVTPLAACEWIKPYGFYRLDYSGRLIRRGKRSGLLCSHRLTTALYFPLTRFSDQYLTIANFATESSTQ